MATRYGATSSTSTGASSTSPAKLRYYAQQQANAATPPSGGGGGDGLFGIHLPSLGLGELAHELGGAATGLGRLLVYDPLNVVGNALVHGPGSEQANRAAHDFATQGDAALSGIGGSLLGTVADVGDIATAGKAHSLTNPIREFAGNTLGKQYQPQSLSEKIKGRGLLPAVMEDVGNAALVSDVAGGLLKQGELGTAANAEATAGRAAKAGATATDLQRAAKAAQKADGIDTTSFNPANITARAKTLETLHDVAHPYSFAFRNAVRPVTLAAQESVLGRAAEAGAIEKPQSAVDVARAHLTESVPAEAGAVAPSSDLVAAMKAAAESEAAKAPAVADIAHPPAPGMVRLYRGEQLGNIGGSEFSDNPAYAQGHAGPTGQVYTVDVPHAVAEAGAETARAAGGVGVTLPEPFVNAAQPLGADALRPATEIATQAPQEPAAASVPVGAPTSAPAAPAAVEAAVGPREPAAVEPIARRQGPYETAARLQSGMQPTEWARTVVDKLPQPVVDRLAAVEAGIEKRITGSVKRELTRLQEAARRSAEDDPAVRTSIEAAKHVLGQTLEDGTRITPAMADKMIGGAVTKLLDSTSLIEKLGVPEDVVNAIVGVHMPIPEALRTPELMDAIGRAAEAWKAVEDRRLGIMAGSRLGMKGLNEIGSDTPTLTKGERIAWKEIVADAKRAQKMVEKDIPRERARIAAAIAAGEGKAGRIGGEITALGDRQTATRSNLIPLVGRDPGEGLPGTFRAPINDAGNGPIPFDRRTVPQLGAGLQNIDQLRDEQALPAETTAQSRQRGYQAGKLVEKHAALQQQIVERTQRQARVQAAVDEMQATLDEHRTPSELIHAKLEGHVQRGIDRLASSLDNPSVARTPGQWKPLWGAVKEIERMTKDNPELAEMFVGVPKGFAAVLREAAARGIEPTFISSLSENDVRKLVYDQAKLGSPGREAVQIESGARKARAGAFARERSISALTGALHAATHEAYSNGVIDFIEQVHAKPWDAAVPPPRGWVQWDGVRAFIRTGTKGESITTTSIIPTAIKKVVEDSSRDFSHGSFTAIQKVQKPWQALMLSLNPAFQVHHFVVKVGLAVAAGARFEDFANAWRDLRANSGKYREAALATNYYGEHAPSIVPQEALGERFAQARAAGGGAAAKQAYEVGLRAISKPLDVVDKLTRSAVYSSVERAGGTSEMALNRAFEALGDYNSLSAFEQQVVRAVMPFYPFQKSIVKIMLKWPIENPKVVALAASLANMNAQAAADAAGAPKGTKLPQGYEDLFTSPIGTLNLHSLDPFAKVEQLVTPQGIVQALNPFLNIAIKNAYGVPNSDHLKRMDPYGHIVDDTSPASDITKLFAGAPQAKLVEGALGLSTPGQAPQTGGAQQAVSKFAGVPIFTAADVQKIVDRMAKSTATLAGTSSSSSGGGGTSGGSKSSASRSSSRYGSGTTKGHKSRIKHVRAPKGVGTGGRRKGVRINTSKVLGAASRHHASTARKVVQRGTSTAGVKFNPSRRSR